MQGGAGGVLAHRGFRLLFSARTISVAGSAFTNVALAFAVLDVTGSKADLGYVLAARLAPQVLLVLVGGIWGDRLPRDRVMFVSSLLSGAIQSVLAALLLAGAIQLWGLLLLAVLSGSSTAFFFPAAQGAIPQTVPRQLLQRANALLRFGLNAGTIAGAALGGLIVAVSSPGTAIAVDAASYFVAAVLVSAMRLTAEPTPAGATFVRDLADGWNEFRSRTWLWTIVLQFALVNALEAGTRNVLGPVVARDHLGGAGAWGLVVAALGLGLVAGAASMAWLRPRRLLLVATCTVALIVALPLTLAFPVSLALTVAGAFVTGLGIEMFSVLWDTTMQQEIPNEKLSRLYAYDNLGSIVLTPAGMAMVGPIAASIGNRPTLIGAAVLVVASCIVILGVRDVRTVERAPTTEIDLSGETLEATIV